MNGTIHASATKQRSISSVNNGVDLQGRDVFPNSSQRCHYSAGRRRWYHFVRLWTGRESLHIQKLRPPAIKTPAMFTQTGISRPAMSTSTWVMVRKRWPRQTSKKIMAATRSPRICDFMFVSSHRLS
jgi:hypothetical protein